MVKKRKKVPTQKYNKNTAIKVNFNRIKQVCEILNCAEALSILSQQEIKEIYIFRMHYEQPKIKKGHKISREKMKFFKHFCQLFYNMEESVLIEGKKPVSVMSIAAVDRLMEWHSCVPEPRATEIKNALHVLFKHFEKISQPLTDLYLNYNKLLAVTNPFTKTMYTLTTAFEYRKYGVHGFYHTITISSVAPRVSKVEINGNKRIIYQIASQSVNDETDWASISAAKLSNLYEGNKEELPIYIQSHALVRYISRVSPIDETVGQCYIAMSIRNEEPFIYRRNVLFPIYYQNFKLGYLIAKPVGDILVISTFLFVTQHGTPEGDKLEKLSGLSKEEITYWNIAKLEVFASKVVTPEEGIFTLFKECNLDYLFDAAKCIKGNENHSYNWDAFTEYMKKGKEQLKDDLRMISDKIDLQEENTYV
jgi:hypothetical protein